jgi:UDP-glucose 6-dehydrogenase
VPGPDNKRGFGGACFPKDTAALIRYANEINKDFSILETAVKYNNNVRKSYKKRDSREREQGVNYDFFNTSKTDNINS